MKNCLTIILILLVGIISINMTVSSSSALAIPESGQWMASILKTPTEKENALIEQGYHAKEYPIMPFGAKYFFYKSDKPEHYLGDIAFNRCAMFATYPIKEGESVNVSMKFPNDLIWPGGYDNSTFFVTRGGHHTYADASGNLINKNTEVVWEKITPVVDSDFTTIRFGFEDEIGSLIVNMTELPDLSEEKRNEDQRKEFQGCCPLTIPEMKYDYYDMVNPINTQRMIAEIQGFPPDTFICKNNLIGAIKKNTDGMEEEEMKIVCVKPDTKTVLVERGWAKSFE